MLNAYSSKSSLFLCVVLAMTTLHTVACDVAVGDSDGDSGSSSLDVSADFAAGDWTAPDGASVDAMSLVDSTTEELAASGGASFDADLVAPAGTYHAVITFDTSEGGSMNGEAVFGDGGPDEVSGPFANTTAVPVLFAREGSQLITSWQGSEVQETIFWDRQ